jgi:hypothetical protein
VSFGGRPGQLVYAATYLGSRLDAVIGVAKAVATLTQCGIEPGHPVGDRGLGHEEPLGR